MNTEDALFSGFIAIKLDTLNFGALEGRRILGVQISQDGKFLRFETDKEPIIYYASGDCCSESWFSGITNLEALLGETVIDIRERDEVDRDADSTDRYPQESTQIYGVDLVTRKGVCYVEFRNSSNGYYGGCAALVTDVGVGLLREEMPPPEEWEHVAEDFFS